MTNAAGPMIVDNYVFVNALVAGPRDYFFVAHHVPSLEEGRYRSHLLRHVDGRWSELASWPWQSVGLVAPSLTPLRVEILGRDGQVGILKEGRVTGENLEAGTALGPMRNIDIVFGRVIAYGMQRQVFVRDSAGTWIRFNRGMANEGPSEGDDIDSMIRGSIRSDGGINAIVPYQTDRLLAFGMRGEIWRFVGESWQSMDSPTNVMLKDATGAPDGDIYVCGLRGTILKGHDDRWQRVQYRGAAGLGLCSIRCFGDKVFVADGHSLRVLAGGELKVIDFGVADVVPCMQVAVGSGEIMSVAGQEVWVSSDGIKWDALAG